MPERRDSDSVHLPQTYRFYAHTRVAAWRLVRRAGSEAPAGFVADDWRLTRARTAEDTNSDVRRQCDEEGFYLFKLGGTFAEVAADVEAAESDANVDR